MVHEKYILATIYDNDIEKKINSNVFFSTNSFIPFSHSSDGPFLLRYEFLNLSYILKFSTTYISLEHCWIWPTHLSLFGYDFHDIHTISFICFLNKLFPRVMFSHHAFYRFLTIIYVYIYSNLL